MSKTVLLRQFNGGMVTDPRDPSGNAFRYATNFDVLTNPYKLTPYHDSESGDGGAATSQKQNFCIANWLPASTNDYRLFSLGVQAAFSGRAEVLMKQLTTTSTDLSDGGWSTPANNQSGIALASFNLFTYYKTTKKIYMAGNGNIIYFSLENNAWSDSEHALTYTNISEGLVHSLNDILYIGYDNKIVRNNAGSWTDAVLTLPANLKVVSLAEKGNFLAIACAPLSGLGGSRVFLWDMSSTTWNESIDWGEGNVKWIKEINGVLVGASLVGGDSTRLHDRIVFREYSGSGSNPFATFTAASSSQLLNASQRIDNRVYFMMQASIDGTIRSGVWSVGLQNGHFTVNQENTVNNNTAMIVSDVLKGFIKVGDFVFQSYVQSSAWGLSKTNDLSSYTATSIYETSINPDMAPGDKIQKKQLVAVGAMYEALPAAGQVIVKYKVDGGAWTTIFTETTANAVFTEPVTRDASGTSFTSGKEYEFHVESTGGAEITGLIYKYEVLGTNI